MDVEHAQAPGGQDEHACPREQNAHQHDGQIAFGAREAGCDDGHHPRRAQESGQRERRNDDGDQGEDRPRHLRRLGVAALRAQSGVDGNERSRERALAEQVLKKIRNAERAVEGVGSVGLQAEEIREGADAQESDDAAGKDAGAHGGGRMLRHADGSPGGLPCPRGE